MFHLFQAAMMQGALSKERREMKMQQKEEDPDFKPDKIGSNWNDPMPDSKSKILLLPLFQWNLCFAVTIHDVTIMW